jgi:hypothetical protein
VAGAGNEIRSGDPSAPTIRMTAKFFTLGRLFCKSVACFFI